MDRSMLARAAAGAVTAAAIVVPSLVSAATVADVTVAHSVGIVNGQCEIAIDATWDETITRGPSVNVQLWESVEGAAPTRVGLHLRTTDDGSDSFLRRFRDAGTYSYELRITKGPKHIIGYGVSGDIVCAP